MIAGYAAVGPLLAAGSPATPANQPGGQGQEFGSSGPVALIVILLLLVAVVFLVRSMGKHLKRIPESFDTTETTPDAESAPEPEPEKAAAEEQPTDRKANGSPAAS